MIRKMNKDFMNLKTSEKNYNNLMKIYGNFYINNNIVLKYYDKS